VSKPTIPPPSPAVASTRGRVAALTRSVRNGERPESDLIEARRAHRAAKTFDYVQKALAEAPPMTDEQAHRIAALLLAGGELGA